MEKITVKNMVCNRCIKVVKEELTKHNIDFASVELGAIMLREPMAKELKSTLREILEKEGFAIVEERNSKIINRLKVLVVEHFHGGGRKKEFQNFSDFLAQELNMEYTQLSKLFSSIEGRSIENFIIAQRIERAKELLVYDELSLSEISYDLEYSSPQHLSRQFKQVTGITATAFKKLGGRKKLDKI